ncbi:response regulator [Pontivivens nitratireducens]|uniref:Response regulator n=1 Tax=Pontivivens nitratireducens TaxID=2758038 RepID=A0A6G7VHN7_9RHOB|nr:response regulator [Pontibrevibacter nitratireducens]QIK39375.1 response regulator [Pontibrevibacter nitratireducens]
MTVNTRKPPAVLIVEDEPLIRMDAIDIVEDAGFRTYEAASADAALLVMERVDDIAILFTDVDMPGSMNGLELAAHVRDTRPSVKILITSGIFNVDQSPLPNGSVVIQKPYAMGHVTRKLQEIAAELDAPCDQD